MNFQKRLELLSQMELLIVEFENDIERDEDTDMSDGLIELVRAWETLCSSVDAAVADAEADYDLDGKSRIY